MMMMMMEGIFHQFAISYGVLLRSGAEWRIQVWRVGLRINRETEECKLTKVVDAFEAWGQPKMMIHMSWSPNHGNFFFSVHSIELVWADLARWFSVSNWIDRCVSLFPSVDWSLRWRPFVLSSRRLGWKSLHGSVGQHFLLQLQLELWQGQCSQFHQMSWRVLWLHVYTSVPYRSTHLEFAWFLASATYQSLLSTSWF